MKAFETDSGKLAVERSPAKAMSLTKMQRRYIWLAGSHSTRILIQGNGKRTRRTLYALTEDEVFVFGYSNPPQWLVHRGLFRPGQVRHSYSLTDKGDAVYQEMLLNGDGIAVKAELELAKLKA